MEGDRACAHTPIRCATASSHRRHGRPRRGALRVFARLGLLRDRDHDGLRNAFERVQSETKPGEADSDNDGKRDGRESPEHDGLTNRREQVSDLYPRDQDTDGDDLEDGDDDEDCDGVPNAAEFHDGTRPLDADTDDDGLEDGEDEDDREPDD
jgi:hypothetical protein